mmetsp:Transcript_820/g.2699  ORF Transcript_820/g.2699 Transcript_820/m.2699 type:complete len:372 (-) Transcript_820:81-1196(-)
MGENNRRRQQPSAPPAADHAALASGSNAVRSDRDWSGESRRSCYEAPHPRRDSMHGRVPKDGGPAATSQAADQPLVIEADAPLIDGLRTLLVHHLKRSIGSSIVHLSVSQAELLEHHLARLASYAQKIVHTLAFATKFLARQDAEAAASEPPSALAASVSSTASGLEGSPPSSAARSGPRTGARAPSGPMPGGSRAAVPRIPMHTPPPEPKTFRKPLKLRDDEILDLYRSAQAEAAIEADWRGIQGPTPSRGGGSSEGDRTGRTSDCSQRGDARTPETSPDSRGHDQEYLRMLSRALQQPGRSPRAVTAELLDPSAAKQELVCCDPRMETMLDGVLGRPGGARGAAHVEPQPPVEAGAMSVLPEESLRAAV